MNKFGKLVIFTLTMVVLIAGLGLTAATAAPVGEPQNFCSVDGSATERWAGVLAPLSFKSGPDEVVSATISLFDEDRDVSYDLPVLAIASDGTANGWTASVPFPNDPGTYRTYLTIFDEDGKCGRGMGKTIIK